MCSDKIIHDRMFPIQSYMMVLQNVVYSWIQGFIQDFLLGREGGGGGEGRFIETFPLTGTSGMPNRNHDL